MSTLVILSSSLAAVTLALSAMAKLRFPGRAAVALVRFGVARRARREAGYALGTLEALTAVSLVVAPVSPWPLAFAATLFLAFSVAIGRALLAGRSFDCGCFGERDRLGSHTLARSVALLAIALLGAAVAAIEAPGSPALLEQLSAFAVAGLLVAQLAVVGALRRDRPFDPRLRGAP